MENYHYCFHAFRRWASPALEQPTPEVGSFSRRSSFLSPVSSGSAQQSRRQSLLERDRSSVSTAASVPGLPRAPAPSSLILSHSSGTPGPPQAAPPKATMPLEASRRGSMSVLLDSDFETSDNKAPGPPSPSFAFSSSSVDGPWSSQTPDNELVSSHVIKSLEQAAYTARRLYKGEPGSHYGRS